MGKITTKEYAEFIIARATELLKNVNPKQQLKLIKSAVEKALAEMEDR